MVFDRSSLLSMGLLGATLVALELSERSVDYDLVHFGSGERTIGAAILIFLAAVLMLQRRLGLTADAFRFGQPARLATTGVFGLTRNPIYCLFLVPIASLAVYSPVAAVLTAAAYVALMTWLVIVPEERVLRATFGSAYDAYCEATPRWIVIRAKRRVAASGLLANPIP
jgi:protein-S-isoprenylcysteine O-methyltransferase Ste14